MNSKYSKLLTVLLVVVIIAIVGIIFFLGFKYYKSQSNKNDGEEFVSTFNPNKKDDKDEEEDNQDGNGGDLFDGIEGTNKNSSEGKVKRYKGYIVAGTIEIPAIKVKYPVIAKSEYSKSSLETSVVELYGPGLNEVGNTTIVGHNYRNGTFFSNNKKLKKGDKIYITDLSGTRLAYTIYEKYEVPDTESAYTTRDTQGAKEISL